MLYNTKLYNSIQRDGYYITLPAVKQQIAQAYQASRVTFNVKFVVGRKFQGYTAEREYTQPQGTLAIGRTIFLTRVKFRSRCLIG